MAVAMGLLIQPYPAPTNQKGIAASQRDFWAPKVGQFSVNTPNNNFSLLKSMFLSKPNIVNEPSEYAHQITNSRASQSLQSMYNPSQPKQQINEGA